MGSSVCCVDRATGGEVRRWGGGMGSRTHPRLDAFARLRALTRPEAVRVALLEPTMTPEERQRLPDRDEILHLASDKARTIGSVPAMRLVLQELRRDGSEPKR